MQVNDLLCFGYEVFCFGYEVIRFYGSYNQSLQPPLNYFNLMKIKEACRSLDQTDMKINQICHKIGIAVCYYFSRLFSKIMGLSPREYREARGLFQHHIELQPL